MKNISNLLFLVPLVVLHFGAAAQVTKPLTTTETPFPTYAEKSRGWHWKEVIPETLTLPEPETVAPPPVAAAKPAEPQGPKPLSSEWIRQNMPKYLDAAIDDPTPQNVSNYLYIQKYSMDASDKFAHVYSRVTMADPLLDENNTRPTWSAATAQVDKAAAKGKEKVLGNLAKKAGIWFFFRSDCEPCHLQAPILKAFADVYGFTVYPISIDGGPLSDSPFKKYAVDRGQAEKVGVKFTPAIFLAKPPDNIVSISQGMLNLADMEQRFIEISAENGLTTEDEYLETRADNKKWLTQKGNKQVAELNSENAKDPNYVRNYLRSLIAK